MVPEHMLDPQGQVWVYQPPHHKTEEMGKERFVFLGERAQEVLAPFLHRVPTLDPDTPLFSPRDAEQERRVSRRAARNTRVQPSQRERARLNSARSRSSYSKRRFRSSYSATNYAQSIRHAIRAATAERRRTSIATAVLAIKDDSARACFETAIEKLPICMDVDRVARMVERVAEMVCKKKGTTVELDVAALTAAAVDAFSNTEPVPHWHPYQLRHSFATRMCRLHGIEVTRVLMGHASIKTTELYAEIDHARGVRAASLSG